MTDLRIRWNDSEWEQICKYLMSKYEVICISSSTYAGIGPHEVGMAMRIVLDRGRWRENLPNAITRQQFKNHMNALKDKLQQQKELEERRQQEQQESLKRIELEEQLQQQRQFELNRPTIDYMMDKMNELFTSHLVAQEKRLPELVGKITREVIIEMLGTDNEKAALEISREAEARVNKLCAVRQRPRVAVIGTMPTQSQILAETYPDIDFVRIDKKLDNSSSKAVKNAVHGCNFVLGMAKNMGVNIRDEYIESVVGKGNYVKVYGAASALKRQVDLCLQQNLIQLAN